MMPWFADSGDLSAPGDALTTKAAEEAGSLIVLQTDELRSGLKPLLKQKAGSLDDHLLLATMLCPSRGGLELRATDLMTFVKTYVPLGRGSRPPDHPVAVDLASLDAVAKVQEGQTVIAIEEDGSEVRALYAGGSVHVPSYALDPDAFRPDVSGVSGVVTAPTVDLLEVFSALRRLASATDRTDLKMLFAYDDCIYACDGTTVMKSDCYFVPVAIKLSDAEIIEALLSVSSPCSQTKVGLVDDSVLLTTDAGFVLFPRRTVDLQQAYRDAIRELQGYFYVDVGAVHKAVAVLGALRDSEKFVTFCAEKATGGGSVLGMHSRAQDGAVSRLVISRDWRGVPTVREGRDEIRMTVQSAQRALAAFARDAGNVRMDVGGGQLVINNSEAKATVVLGAVGSDR